MAKKKDDAAPAKDEPTPTEATATATAAPKPEAPKSDAPKSDAPAPAAAQKPDDSPAGGKKKPGVPPRRGKKLRNHLKNVEKKLREAGPVPIKAAVAELKKLKRAKFDETVEIHIDLGIDVTQSDKMVRGAIPLPHGIGKSVRVAVFCQGDKVAKAKAAGGG